LNLPNVYWTLVTPFATIIGMYTNVPEGGSIDSTQQQWITNEFATAPTDRALILALHHPIYSFDAYHSGSSKMADVLENAIRDTGRVPNLVLSGHVHDYQRIEQSISGDAPTPFHCWVVCEWRKRRSGGQLSWNRASVAASRSAPVSSDNAGWMP
jgi:hypothetical protein